MKVCRWTSFVSRPAWALVLCLGVAGCDKASDDVHRLRGDSLRRSGKYESALESYCRIPTNRQGIAVLRSMAEAYAMLEDYSNLVAVSRRIYGQTRSADDLGSLFDIEWEYDAFDAAVGVARELVALDTNNWRYKHLLVGALLVSAASNQAAEAIQEFAAAAPATASNAAELGTLWLEAGNHTSAIPLFATALETHGDHHDWRFALARALIVDEQHRDALSNLQVLAAALPDDAEAKRLLGDVLTLLCRQDEAIAAYRAVIRLGKANGAVLNNLAYLLLQQPGGLSEGYELALDALKHDRSFAALDTVGYACYRRGSYDTALRYLREAEAQMHARGLKPEPEIEYHLASSTRRRARPGVQ